MSDNEFPDPGRAADLSSEQGTPRQHRRAESVNDRIDRIHRHAFQRIIGHQLVDHEERARQ